MLFRPGFDQFWMRFDVLGTQKPRFRRRPRLDTPLSNLEKTPRVGFDPTTSRSLDFKAGVLNHWGMAGG